MKTVPPTSSADVSFTSSGRSHGGYGGTAQFFGLVALAFLRRSVALTAPQPTVALIGATCATISNIADASSTFTPGGELRTHS